MTAVFCGGKKFAKCDETSLLSLQRSVSGADEAMGFTLVVIAVLDKVERRPSIIASFRISSFLKIWISSVSSATLLINITGPRIVLLLVRTGRRLDSVEDVRIEDLNDGRIFVDTRKPDTGTAINADRSTYTALPIILQGFKVQG